MSKIKVLVYWLLFFGMLIMNYLSTLNVGDETDNNQAIIQPAGWAFSIWGLIYILLFIWLIRITIMAFQNQTHKHDYLNTGYWPAANFVLNGLWIYVFSEASKLLSTFVIAALLITLVMIYRKVQHRPFDKIVFGIYFAWVTVATIVNIFTWIKATNISTVLGMDELTWTIIMLIVATLLAAYISVKYRDFVYPLVFVYAFTAIWAENGFHFDGLGITLAGSIIVQLAVSVYNLTRNREKVVKI
ncbi:tryptophan-rich sensory protein [Macrococcus hajekii]|uniref:Tryptophan-rich sensory protein n=1 Tax=Macrococcus hajekii TaxID=198482 RepID=A0A4R6BK00_9STAP|nr:TspO/MBR family protein [Macrococcus hajekii]TDM01977.1 tryptophan-rich sensory protein [Macrococcus hajekii]GGB08994.1 hypothetical protein GCM10007190_16300 [Macrococcus hajekii]